MDQFLAQPALIYGIKLKRRLVAAVRLNLDRFGLKRLMDVGLDSQILEKESQQGQSGDPLPGGTRRRKEAGATRHSLINFAFDKMSKRFTGSPQLLLPPSL